MGQRYNGFVVFLHWAMGLAFLMMLGSGLTMANMEALEPAFKFKLYQLHKSGGVLLLLAFFIRLTLRFICRPPSLPEGFKRAEALAAHAMHWGLYALMIALPLSGWAMASSSVYGLPTIVFNMFEWPHIPGISADEGINALAKQGHQYLAFILMAMIVFHAMAVVKHALFEKENLLKRMWWSV